MPHQPGDPRRPRRPLDPAARRRFEARLYEALRRLLNDAPGADADPAWTDETKLRALQRRGAALLLDARLGTRAG